jgi:two-component sensor histidine kinase
MTHEPTRLVQEEIHHRFLNTLTALYGFLRRDFAAFDDPDVRDAVTTLEGRLMAFAGVHRTLHTCSASGRIDVPTYFAKLCAQLCSAQFAPRGIHCDFSADEGDVRPEVGEKLGLILVELVTNCAKHAFPEPWGGSVQISFRRQEGGWTCVVRDDGRGMQPGQAGEGLRLVRDLAHAIQAEVTFQSDGGGVQVTVRLPDAEREDENTPKVRLGSWADPRPLSP